MLRTEITADQWRSAMPGRDVICDSTGRQWEIRSRVSATTLMVVNTLGIPEPLKLTGDVITDEDGAIVARLCEPGARIIDLESLT